LKPPQPSYNVDSGGSSREPFASCEVSMPASMPPAEEESSRDASEVSPADGTKPDVVGAGVRRASTVETSPPILKTPQPSGKAEESACTEEDREKFRKCFDVNADGSEAAGERKHGCLELLAAGVRCPETYWLRVRELLVEAIEDSASRRAKASDTDDAVKQRKWMSRYLTTFPVPPKNGLQRLAECCLDDSTWPSLDKWTFA
ncbi:hypothetical protein FOZ62_013505, partial [Perkinsus olseni]